jgi:hypothetical protein
VLVLGDGLSENRASVRAAARAGGGIKTESVLIVRRLQVKRNSLSVTEKMVRDVRTSHTQGGEERRGGEGGEGGASSVVRWLHFIARHN